MVALEREINKTAPSRSTAVSADAIPLRQRRVGGTTRQAFLMAAIGTLVLALFASHDLSSWLARMGDGRLLAPLQQAAAELDGAMSDLGLTKPAEALRAAIRWALDTEWSGDD